MNLREFCRLPNFPTAVLTTYNLDPLFFERVVLFDLIAGGALRILLLVDEEQTMPAISRACGQLMALGRRYRMIPVRLKGSFHPKVCLRLGGGEALVACGSHNLTRSGWLGRGADGKSGGNRESTVVWRIAPGTSPAYELRSNVERLINLLELPGDRDELRSCLAPTWWEPTGADLPAPPGPTWGVFGVEQTIGSTLEQRWRGRHFERLRITTGSTDRQAAMIRWAARIFGISEATVEVDITCCSFDPAVLVDIPVQLRIRPYDGQPRTHLKAALFESTAGCAAVVGSANCSGSAWLRTAAEGGNVESVVIYDNLDAADIVHLFRSDQGAASPWEAVALAPPADEQRMSPTHYCLRRLQIRRSSGDLTALLTPSWSGAAHVSAVIQSSRVPLTPTNVAEVWRGPQPDVIEGPETLFGHVEIDREGGVELTNATWVDDLDRLAEAAGRQFRFDAVGRLSSSTTSSEYKRLLDDLRVLSETLLSKPAEFPDGLPNSHRKDPRQKDHEPAKPVNASELIRSLDELSPQHASIPMIWAQPGTVSLTGIMRILFTEDTSGSDTDPTDPTEVEHRKSAEEQERDMDETSSEPNGGPTNAVETGPTPSQRQHLLEQVNLFVDRLSETRFGDNCSARQLQQAAAYPLAVTQFACRGPWAGATERTQFAEIIRRECELLFCHKRPETESKTGMPRSRPPLVEEVRARYAGQGRASDFDQIIGDGTLWLVVMRSLAMMGEQPGQRFAKNLALCDVARCNLLWSAATPASLAPLTARLWRDSEVDVPGRIKRLVEALDSLEQYLGGRFEEWKRKPAFEPHVGDWLWNPNAGFAEVIEVKEWDKAKVHIRKRAQTVLVVLPFYINLRGLSERDEEFASLLAACSE